MLVIIGATSEGKKELLGFQVDLRESAQSWKELLVDLKGKGLTIAPFLIGRLAINKKPLFVSFVTLKNREAFSPETGVKIQKLHVQIAFEPLGESGPFFLKSMTEKVEGRAYGIMNFAESEAVSFSDYAQVGK